MLITKISELTGIEHTMDLRITEDQLRRFENGEHVQHVFPKLSPDEREFLLTGITADEWADVFPPEDENEETNHAY